MSQMLKNTWPFWLVSLVFCVLTTLWTPFFGLMDDAHYLRMTESISQEGLVAYSLRWLPGDLEIAGRFRPLLPTMAHVFYGVAPGNPYITHLWNGIAAIAILWLVAVSLGRLWRQIAPKQQNPLINLIIFCLLLAYPWTHLGIVLPAMQEKIVLLAAAIALFVFTSPKIYALPLWQRTPIYLAALCFGSIIREQFIIFFPLLLAASYAKDERLFTKQNLIILASMLAIVIEIWLLGRGNSYKSKYSRETLIHTLTHAKSFWLLFAIAVAAVARVLFAQQSWRSKLLQFAPSLSLLGFLCLMAPWGMGGYLNTVAAPCFVLSVLMAMPTRFFALPRSFYHWGAALIVIGLSLVLYIDLRVKQDLGKILALAELKELAQTHQIYAPCEEGAGAMNRWTERFFGYELRARVPESLAAAKKPSVWILGPHLGCWPGDFDPNALVQSGGAKLLWMGSSRWSQRLLLVE